MQPVGVTNTCASTRIFTRASTCVSTCISTCISTCQVFISELLLKLQGLQKQEDLHNGGIDLPQLHIYSTRSGSVDREVLH